MHSTLQFPPFTGRPDSPSLISPYSRLSIVFLSFSLDEIHAIFTCHTLEVARRHRIRIRLLYSNAFATECIQSDHCEFDAPYFLPPLSSLLTSKSRRLCGVTEQSVPTLDLSFPTPHVSRRARSALPNAATTETRLRRAPCIDERCSRPDACAQHATSGPPPTRPRNPPTSLGTSATAVEAGECLVENGRVQRLLRRVTSSLIRCRNVTIICPAVLMTFHWHSLLLGFREELPRLIVHTSPLLAHDASCTLHLGSPPPQG
ncbi:hypothetical protein FB107DRAFT_271983 [Schizophyllum commune]